VAAGPKRLLIVVSAPSGAGKTTLCERVAARLPGLVHLVSYTTRQPRPDEADGRDYHFVPAEQFRAMIAAGEFAEWAEVHGALYGTSRALLEACHARGEDVILDIDTQGAATLRRAYPDGVFVFILAPDPAALERRLRARRTDQAGEIRRRLARAREEVRHYADYQYVIVNEEVGEAEAELGGIIRAERCRSARFDPGILRAYA
jgi:guanylate kinase